VPPIPQGTCQQLGEALEFHHPVLEQLLGGSSTNPSEKYAEVKLDHFPRVRDKHKKYLSCHHLDKAEASQNGGGRLFFTNWTKKQQVPGTPA